MIDLLKLDQDIRDIEVPNNFRSFPVLARKNNLDFNSLHLNDEKSLIETLTYNDPDFLLKFDIRKDFIDKKNYLILKLTKIYNKYSQPYNLGYCSLNRINKLYNFNNPFQVIEYTLNSDFEQFGKKSEVKNLNLKSDSSVISFARIPIKDKNYETILTIRGGVNLDPRSFLSGLTKLIQNASPILIAYLFEESTALTLYNPKYASAQRSGVPYSHQNWRPPTTLDSSRNPNQMQPPPSGPSIRPVGKPTKGPSSEMTVNSKHQETPIIITDKDVKRCITQKDRELVPDDQRFNERLYKHRVGIRITNPDEVYQLDYQGKPSTIYLEKAKTEGDPDIVAIVDNASGRLIINSEITREEYQDLTEATTSFELNDYRRDSQTGIMNQKSIGEAKTMEAAQDVGFVEDFRRPKVHLGEKDDDFVSLDGSKKYEIKKVTQNRHKSYQDSANDILKYFKRQKSFDPSRFYIIDTMDIPNFLQPDILNKMETEMKAIPGLSIDKTYFLR